MGDEAISDDAVRKATGRGWDDWFVLLDGLGPMDHSARAKRLAEAAPELSGWWCQMVTVEYERRRGLRQVGESSTGGFQFSVSKTVDWGPAQAFDRVIATPFLPEAEWKEGTTWTTEGADVEVRRVDPGKMLRWFWTDDDGTSTVEVTFPRRGDKTAITFRHHRLASKQAIAEYRPKWKDVLEEIASR